MIKKAVVIHAIGKYSSVLLHIAFMALFSRILSPDEFGIVAVINAFALFFELFCDFGIGTAIIQSRKLSDRMHRELFSLMLLFGIFLGGVFVWASLVISHIYGDPVYRNAGAIFSIVITLTAFNTVPDALIMKEKMFLFSAVRSFAANLISYSIAVAFAFYGISFYSLILRSLLCILLQLGMNIAALHIAPVRVRSLECVRMIRSYSIYQFAASMINYLQRNLDNILVGKYIGTRELAYYDKSYSLTRYPISYLSNVITPVLHPILAEHQDETEFIYRRYREIISILSFAGIVISGIFISSSEEIVFLLFGDQWGASVVPLRIISFSIWSQMLTSTVGCIMQSLGNTKSLFKMCCVSLLFSVVGIGVGVWSGDINALAVLIAVVYLCHFGIYFFFTMTEGFHIGVGVFLRDLSRDIGSLIIVYIISVLLVILVRANSTILCLGIKLGIVSLTIIILSFTLLRSNYAVRYIKSKLLSKAAD